MEYIIRSRKGPGDAFVRVGAINVEAKSLHPQDRHKDALRQYFNRAAGSVSHTEFLVGLDNGSLRLYRLSTVPEFTEL